VRAERDEMMLLNNEDRYSDVWWALRIGLGGAAFFSGADKFTHLVCNWDKYLAPRVEEMLPMSGKTFMRLVGVIEMAVGLGVLFPPRTKLHSYVLSAWLVGIAGNLMLHDENYADIALRDLDIALGAYALARLTGNRQKSAQPAFDETLLKNSIERLTDKAAKVGAKLRETTERSGGMEQVPRERKRRAA
jgi:uncharacterized membrane protein YphA (DoxX/SURF4 family)